MFRFGEAFLAVAPLLAAALLYGVWYRRLPSRRAVLGLCVAELLFASALIWQGTAEGLRPHERYVPAKLQHGDLVEGHGG
jgi:hypothetical protein